MFHPVLERSENKWKKQIKIMANSLQLVEPCNSLLHVIIVQLFFSCCCFARRAKKKASYTLMQLLCASLPVSIKFMPYEMLQHCGDSRSTLEVQRQKPAVRMKSFSRAASWGKGCGNTFICARERQGRELLGSCRARVIRCLIYHHRKAERCDCGGALWYEKLCLHSCSDTPHRVSQSSVCSLVLVMRHEWVSNNFVLQTLSIAMWNTNKCLAPC